LPQFSEQRQQGQGCLGVVGLAAAPTAARPVRAVLAEIIASLVSSGVQKASVSANNASSFGGVLSGRRQRYFSSRFFSGSPMLLRRPS